MLSFLKLTLHGGETNAARRSVNKDIVALLNVGANHERAVARRCRHEQARGLGEGPTLGHRQQGEFLGAHLGGKGTLGSTEHARTGRELWVLCALGRRYDDAGELGASDPREGCIA